MAGLLEMNVDGIDCLDTNFLPILVINTDIKMFTLSNGYVYFSHYCDDDRARVSTGIKTDNLDKERESLKKSERMLLNRVEDAATKHIESCNRSQAKLLKAELETVVAHALGRSSRKRGGFEADFIGMIEEMKNGEMLQPKKKIRYSDSTIETFDKTLKLLQRYAAEENRKLTYDLNEAWVNSFIAWMARPGMKERKLAYGHTKIVSWPGFAQNTIANMLRYFKAFLGHMYGKKHSNLFYKHSVFNVPTEETDAESLSPAEIISIHGMEVERKALKRAKDVMIFGCWVGLRAEDLENINNYKLKNGRFEFFNQKSGETVIIPAHPMAREIWEKYDGQLPVIEKRVLWARMADICKLAGLMEQCMVTITRGGLKRVEYYEKWQMITPHSLRRTFVTNGIKAGIPDRKMMLFSGHTTETSFRKYIRLKKKENAEELADHSFFKGE